MDDGATRQEILDAEHLRLLRIGYFIAAGTNVLWVFFPLLYVGMGALMLSGAFRGAKPADVPPKEAAMFFMAIGFAISLIMAALTLLKFFAARAIGHRQSKILILVTAGISCLGIPWGTVLGVLTLLVLSRPSVAAQFERAT